MHTSSRLRVILDRSVADHWPLGLAVVQLWLAVAVLLLLSLARNDGHLTYAIDDAYIHMAIAKNFSLHGVWGVTRYEFSSSSSSPLWTFVLSFAYLLFGPNEWAPLALNIVASTLVILVTHAILRRYTLSQAHSSVLLSAVIFLTPLPTLTFVGMEHVLQVLLTILFAYLFVEVSSRDHPGCLLLAVAPLLTLTRYESLFLVTVACILLVLRKRWLYGVSLMAVAILPLAAFGAVSVAHGCAWLPNSIILKGAAFNPIGSMGPMGLLIKLPLMLMAAPHVLALLFATLFVYQRRLRSGRGVWEAGQVMLVLFAATSVVHLQLASAGWFYRYEAYLVALGVLALGTAGIEVFRALMNASGLSRWYAITVLLIVMVPQSSLIVRAVYALTTTVQATVNVYERQYQMGLFLKEFYQTETVAVNDIGAVNYLADIRCLDLVGLGSPEVARLRMQGLYDTEQVSRLTQARGAKIAVAYDHWFRDGDIACGGVPDHWREVGRWRIPDPVTCCDVVSFYSIDPSEEGRLAASLQAFSSRLPKDVEQSGKCCVDRPE